MSKKDYIKDINANGLNNADKYRDLSRYRKSNDNNSNIRLASSSFSRNNVHNDINEQSHADSNHSAHSHKKNVNHNSAADQNISQYSRNSNRKYSHKRIKKKKTRKKRLNILKAAIAACILIALCIGVYKVFPIKVNVNGKEVMLTYDKSLEEAIKQSEFNVVPGNFIAVDYSVIRAGEGFQNYTAVNGQEATDWQQSLRNGDQIEYSNGKDRMEDYTSNDTDIKSKSKIEGVGAIHKFEGNGENGTWSEMYGKVSKKYAERQTKAPSDVVCKNYNADPENEKVIALTFDDGPSDKYTEQILNILEKNNAKATFFVIGEKLEEDWAKNLLSKEDSAGHLVCTHTYTHGRAEGGTSITDLTAEKQIQEVTKGQMAISKVLGKNASTICRLPGGNINATTVRLIAPYVTAEIGWNLDSGDWQRPGKKKILSALDEASSGDIILCHDGGGDRSETVEAIAEFIPKYINKGYKFITVDEMLKYKEAPQDTSLQNSTNYSGSSNNSYGNTYSQE